MSSPLLVDSAFCEFHDQMRNLKPSPSRPNFPLKLVYHAGAEVANGKIETEAAL